MRSYVAPVSFVVLVENASLWLDQAASVSPHVRKVPLMIFVSRTNQYAVVVCIFDYSLLGFCLPFFEARRMLCCAAGCTFSLCMAASPNRKHGAASLCCYRLYIYVNADA